MGSVFTFASACNLVVASLTVIVVVSFLPHTYQQIVIDTHGKYKKWDGCLYRKVRIAEENQTSCYKCSVDSSLHPIVISLTDWSQDFINCTEFCEYATICTKTKYYTTKDMPPVERPLCYQCENRKDEVIWFEAKYHQELCPQDCKRCSDMVDLSDAVKCAPVCRGYPTFCYPMMSKFGERICYQARFWYGCDYIPVYSNMSYDGSGDYGGVLTDDCKKCAREANSPENAQYCAYACSFYPTYFNGSMFLQCRPHAFVDDKNNDLFLYNVPNEIIKYLHLSNVTNIYPAEVTDNKLKYLDGYISNQINREFNIAKFNDPLPYKYRMRKANDEALDIVSLLTHAAALSLQKKVVHVKNESLEIMSSSE